ncbi:pisatin demethylase (cytochrome P450) [Apiospora phragmitis]|uniref:Pisatin demethylase (Cytochrome P450) n=1 Tax=Apiospora phragmitis TaxID=2905665 RepID=A0ABR1V0T3_9PEZI
MGIVTAASQPAQHGLLQSIVLPCLLALVAVFLLQQFRSWYRLRHIPGPFWASVSSFWMVRKALTGKLHEHLRDISEKYGPLVRIGPNEVLSTDPDVLRMMSAVRSSYTKGDFYETGRICHGEDNVVSQRNEAEHKALRAKMTSAFGGRENEGFGFGAGIDRQVSLFMTLINDRYCSTAADYRPLQFFEKVSFFTLDVIGDISFGEPFGYLSQDQDLYRYHEIHDSSLPAMNIMSTMPWLAKYAQAWPFSKFMPNEHDQIGFGRLMGYVTGLPGHSSIGVYSLAPSHRKSMMQAFINSGMTRAELIQQVFVQTIAGSMTTATAISMTMLCLITTPVAYMALRREIDDAADLGKLSSPISESEAKKLPYLQAVIREGLRMYPPTTGLGSKQVPKGGDIVNGCPLPEGTQIGTNYFGLMRSRELWGYDANVFRPERWLEASEEKYRFMANLVDLEFGFGKYQCLGKSIAMMELNKVFVELLRRFDFTIVNPQTPIRAWSAVFWVASDFWLRISQREDRKGYWEKEMKF